MAYFDLRLPLGWLFLIVGGLLLVAGFAMPDPALAWLRAIAAAVR